MELQDLSATLAETTFAPYASVLSAAGEIRGLVVSGGASMSRKRLDELQEFAKRYGAGALAWIKLGDELSSSLLEELGHDMGVDLAGGGRAQKGGAVLVVRAKAYDAVINGVEVAGGSIRIHRRDVQQLVFKALGMTEEMARARFGFFLEALAYGTPPHGGIASGIERTLMVLVPTENIRDVMAFPKTASAQDLMIDAPGEVDAKQLEELHLKIMKD